MASSSQRDPVARPLRLPVALAIALLSGASCTPSGPPPESPRARSRPALAHEGASLRGKPIQKTRDGRPVVGGELLVRFKDRSASNRGALHRRAGATLRRSFGSVRGLDWIELPAGTDPERAAEQYRSDPSVLFAEPNLVFGLATRTPNDEYFGEQWGLQNQGLPEGVVDADLNAPEAWALTTGSDEVVVGVIDTGVNLQHLDLLDNLWVNPGEIPNNGVDDDANGWVDDLHGINVLTGLGNPRDDDSHGSHVSGTIAARGDNGRGVTGVAWRSKIIGCKIFDRFGRGDAASAITCLDYFAQLRTRPQHPTNLVATNNSWGGYFESVALRDAIATHLDLGILFVAAAGNFALDNDTRPHYPASYELPNVIAVAATNRFDALASFSNYGRFGVHISAPGEDIFSTTVGQSYELMSGTSMAAPHVTGLIALLKAQDPTRDWRALRNLVLAGGQDVAAFEAKTLSGKRLRAADGDGRGSLTCVGQRLSRRVQPRSADLQILLDDALRLEALHIECDHPAGPLSIPIEGTSETVELRDDGRDGDEVAADGLYRAQWRAPTPGDYTLLFPGADRVHVRVLQGYRQADANGPFEWRAVGGEPLALTGSQALRVSTPFPIHFGGHPGFTEALVATKGVLSFTPGAVFEIDQALPSPSHQTLVAPFWFWTSLEPDPPGQVLQQVLGTAPHREWVLEWREIGYERTTEMPHPSFTFQVVFKEGSPEVLFNYLDVDLYDGLQSEDRGSAATVGLQVSPGAATQFSRRERSLVPELSLRWTLNARPSLVGLEAAPAVASEGAAVTLRASVLDADGAVDAPWHVEFDFNPSAGGFKADATATVAADGTAELSQVFHDSGRTTIAARAIDLGGAASSIETRVVEILNAPPTLTAVTAEPPGAAEGGSVRFTSSLDDPGVEDGPWSLEWDLDFDGTHFSPDGTRVLETLGPFWFAQSFARDGSYRVALRVTDRDGGISKLQIIEVRVSDLAPAVAPLQLPSSALEGEPVAIGGSFSDPGDAASPWRIELDFDYDGSVFSADATEDAAAPRGFSFTHRWLEQGTRVVAVRVVDADGSTSAIATASIEVADVDPIIESVQALPTEGFEPRTVEFLALASSGSPHAEADPIRFYRWDFDGDGATDLLASDPRAVFRYPDNPPGGDTWTARVAVEDEDGRTDFALPVRVTNQPPVLEAFSAPPPAVEGVPFSLQLTARDPAGAHDPLRWSLARAPEGMAISGTGLVSWTPRFDQASASGVAWSLEASVSDDDGGRAFATFTVTARWSDLDLDGMPDTWERANGCDPSRQDALSDADGDGVPNLDEFRDQHGGPRLPGPVEPLQPVRDAMIRTPLLRLAVANAVDPDSATLTYEFAVCADELCSTVPVTATAPEDPSGTTLVEVDGTALADGRRYAWRARAFDGVLRGPWSALGWFAYNPIDAPPTTPLALAPTTGARIGEGPVTLTVAAARDADGDRLSYQFVLARDPSLGQTVQFLEVPETSTGVVSVTVDAALLEPNTRYWWHARAHDGFGPGLWTEPRELYFRPANLLPTAPLALLPADGARVETPPVVLSVYNSRDPEDDPLTYQFSVALDPAFEQPAADASAPEDPSGRTSVSLGSASLAANTIYWWRARAVDGGRSGPWSESRRFDHLPANVPPTAPLPLAPPDGSPVRDADLVLTVLNARDLEGQPLLYEFELFFDAELTRPAMSARAAEASSGSTSATFDGTLLVDDTDYFWRVRADDGRSSGAWSQARQVRFNPIDGEPGVPLSLAPVPGARVDEPSPALVVANARDPDGDPLTYEFVVATDVSFTAVAASVFVAEDPTGRTIGHLPATQLTENTRYWWRARATDGTASGRWSEVRDFVYRPANREPGVPVPLLEDRRLLTGDLLSLTIVNARDPEAAPLRYEFALYADAGLAAPLATAELAEDPSGATTARFDGATLTDDAEYWWRARAHDGALAGAWTQARRVRYSRVNSPPLAPLLLSPAYGAASDERRPALVLLEASDPEEDALAYEFEVRTATTPELTAAAVGPVAEQNGATRVQVPAPLAPGRYLWRARGIDTSGAVGPWSADANFEILDDAIKQPPPAGCGSVPGPDGSLAALAALGFLARRRRRAGRRG